MNVVRFDKSWFVITKGIMNDIDEWKNSKIYYGF